MTSLLYPTTDPSQTETLDTMLVIAKGEGVFLFDDKGKRYLEGMAGLWCTTLGYGNEELVETVERQMRMLSYGYYSGQKTNPAVEELREKLAAMVPIADPQVIFGCSGSEANDIVLKFVRAYAQVNGTPERTKIIARDAAYHGVTVGTTCLTGLPQMYSHFQLPFDSLGVLRTGASDYLQCAQPDESQEAFVARRATELESLIIENNPDTIAVMIAEPVSAGGGVFIPPDGYFEAIQAVLDEHGILLWDDEVVCGFGRLGADFGANKLGMQPDMMVCAKGLSSAYFPISAAVIKGDMAAVINAQGSLAEETTGSEYTYSGHPAACSVAAKVIDIYHRDGLCERAARMGDYLSVKLGSLQRHPLVHSVFSVGLLGAVELMFPEDPKLHTAVYCCQAAEHFGLILRPVMGSRLAICPPLIITEKEIDMLVDILAKALDVTYSAAEEHIRKAKG